MNLPPLPNAARSEWRHGLQIDHYAADQMRAYALAVAEEAARVCEAQKADLVRFSGATGAQKCADAIRQAFGLQEKR